MCALEFEIFLTSDPVFVAAAKPVGEVHFGNGVWKRWGAGRSKCLDDATVGEAIFNHGVDVFAGGLGQAGDFAIVTTVMTAGWAWFHVCFDFGKCELAFSCCR
jgi:hypothetical protein